MQQDTIKDGVIIAGDQSLPPASEVETEAPFLEDSSHTYTLPYKSDRLNGMFTWNSEVDDYVGNTIRVDLDVPRIRRSAG